MESQWPDVFEIGLDKDEAAISRRLMRQVKLREVVVIAGLAVVLYSGWLLATSKELDYTAAVLSPAAVLAALCAVTMGYFLRRNLNREFPFPDDAFHLAAGGLTLFVAGAVHPVRLPWESVRSMEIRLRQVRWTLTVTLADDPGAATGLDQPVVRRSLLHRDRRIRGLWYDVDALTEPFTRIEAAVRHYSGGSAAIHNPYRRFVPERH